MPTHRRIARVAALALPALVALPMPALAAPPSPADALALKPRQKGVEFAEPSDADLDAVMQRARAVHAKIAKMSVAERVAAVVGRPTLVPYWAFGLMNSKYGYASAAQTERVLDSFEAAGVPVRTEGRQFLCCAVAAADSHLFPPLL